MKRSPLLVAVAFAASLVGAAPSSIAEDTAPSVEFTLVPPAGGGPGRREPVTGKVAGVDPSRVRVVLYAKTDRWYVQPLVAAPFTRISSDRTWRAEIHLGVEYAALLVQPGYRPRPTTDRLPRVGGDVLAIARRDAQ